VYPTYIGKIIGLENNVYSRLKETTIANARCISIHSKVNFNPYPDKMGSTGLIAFISSYNMRINYSSAVNSYEFVHAKKWHKKNI
jgi:hypothetical protein